jgi:hypothetical protein
MPAAIGSRRTSVETTPPAANIATNQAQSWRRRPPTV